MVGELTKDTDILSQILMIMEDINHIRDLDALLDRVLLEARRLSHADAGSIFLVEGNLLKFSYVHNESLFGSEFSNKYLYTSNVVEINNESISGHVALTGESVIVDDAYHIPPSVPFSFKRSFDSLSGYHTQSILTVPLKTSRDKIVGVIQIINALDSEKNITPFTEKDKLVMNYFANNAAVAVERALMTREIILRMVKMCELRDPKETGAHANRVGAYTAEIYQRWALNKGVHRDEVKKNKDLLRISAMLHDLGKIAISDVILKKPGKLDDDEYQIMKYHSIHGARFFENATSDLDSLSAEIALNHHERWDGKGYPGRINNLYEDNVQMGEGKQGEEIPICARIVALADVYDALISRRTYKDPFPEEKSLQIIREEAGRQFDPEVVEAFFSIYDVITAIRDKYQEGPPELLFCRIAP